MDGPSRYCGFTFGGGFTSDNDQDFSVSSDLSEILNRPHRKICGKCLLVMSPSRAGLSLSSARFGSARDLFRSASRKNFSSKIR